MVKDHTFAAFFLNPSLSNLCTEASDQDNVKQLEDKVKELVSLTDRLGKAGKSVIILKRVERLDEKMRWNLVMDKLVQEKVSELKNESVQIRDLGIKCCGKQDQETIFGKGTRVFDGIHLRGPSGMRVFTNAFVQLLQSLLLTKAVIK